VNVSRVTIGIACVFCCVQPIPCGTDSDLTALGVATPQPVTAVAPLRRSLPLRTYINASALHVAWGARALRPRAHPKRGHHRRTLRPVPRPCRGSSARVLALPARRASLVRQKPSVNLGHSPAAQPPPGQPCGFSALAPTQPALATGRYARPAKPKKMADWFLVLQRARDLLLLALPRSAPAEYMALPRTLLRSINIRNRGSGSVSNNWAGSI